MDIGEVAKLSGLPASTLRFYEEKGLIESVGRHGLRRIFDANVLDLLSLISLGRLAGFSLDEINNMFINGSYSKINRQLLSSKADQLDETITRLAAIRDGLRHTISCPAPNHFECPKFKKMLRIANKQVRRSAKG
ncbi:helix-turn-helix domain-containing protein [Enterovibrio makurazakiensis]